MTDSINFYNPTQIPDVNLGITQEDEFINFKTTNGVYITDPIVRINFCEELVKDYTLIDGLTLIGNNVQGEEKTLRLTLQGADFSGFKGSSLKAECFFYGVGDVNITFKINVK